jgi:hypothetical protein
MQRSISGRIDDLAEMLLRKNRPNRWQLPKTV